VDVAARAIALAAAGGALLWGDWRHARRLSLGTVATVGAWGISGLLALASAQGRVSTGTMQFMRDYWSSGFLPFPPRTWDELKWPAYTLRVIIAEVTDWRWSYAYFALAVVGGWAVWRRSRPVALTLAAPIVGAMAAAALGRYPLEGAWPSYSADRGAARIGGDRGGGHAGERARGGRRRPWRCS
jgi:hypothetical protein